MRHTHTWVPPKGTTNSVVKWNEEFVYTRAYVETQKTEEIETEITRYGLWFIHPITGEERTVEAPFFRSGRHLSNHGVKMFRLRGGTHEGALVMSMGIQKSYDIAYFLFTYDGVVWRQVTQNDSPRSQELLLEEQEFRVWEEPGPLDSRAWVIAGGQLLSISTSMLFAVDNTHAFAYDSGPDSPRSDAFLRALKVLEETPSRWPPLSSELQDKIKEAIPDEIRPRVNYRSWLLAMSEKDKAVLVPVDHAQQGLQFLMRFASDL